MKIRRNLLIFCSLLASLPQKVWAGNLEDLRHFRWLSGKMHNLSNALGFKPQVFKSPSKLKVGNETIIKDFQYIDGIKVQDSWIQIIRNSLGMAVYAQGATIPEVSVKMLKNKIASASKNTKYLNEFIDENSELKLAKQIFSTKLEIVHNKDSKNFEPAWSVEYIDAQEKSVWRMVISPEGKLIEKRDIAAHLAEGRAEIFPKGPRWSDLSVVSLPGMLGDGSLTNPLFRVESALGNNAWSANLFFQYNTNDPRFDEVQDYYYINQATDWLAQKVDAKLTEPLSVVIHYGEASNSSFYYHNQIRIGSGDGETYKDIPKDPSVVIHELIHAYVDTYSGLDTQGEAGALNEAFADFFTACILDNPRMGESSYLKGPYRRNIENQLKAYVDFSSSMYNNSTVISGTFWELRKNLGTDKAANLAFRTMLRLGKQSAFADFTPAIINAGTALLTADELKILGQVLADRNWKGIDENY